MEKLASLETEIGLVEKQITLLTKQRETLKQQAIKEFELKYGHNGAVFINGDTNGVLTRTLQPNYDYDVELAKEIFGNNWQTYQRESVDPVAIESALKLGTITQALVDTFRTSKEVDKLTWRQRK